MPSEYYKEGKMLNSRTFRYSAVVCAVSISLLFAALAHAADDGEAARAILSKWGDAVISVKATTKVRVVIGGSEQKKEEETETLATVIDPSGLAVLSFSSIDPTRIYGGVLKKLKASGEGPEVDITSEIAGITMVFADGREVPAKIVLKDSDQDLAFIRPAEKLDKPAPAVDLSLVSTPSVMDTILTLGRLDKAVGGSPSVSLNRIEAIITNPRKVYVADSDTLMSRLGGPVFSLDGKLVGFSLLKMTKATDKTRMGNMLSGGMGALGIMPVVVPAGDVTAVAKQALAAKEK